MTAKTISTDDQRKDGEIVAYKMKAGEVIYKGSTVMKDSSGYAYTNDGTTNVLADGDIFLGICVEEMDNSEGVAGDLNVRVYRNWTVIYDFFDTITQANIGDTVYNTSVNNDGQMTTTAGISTDEEVVVWKIVEFISANVARFQIDGAVDNVVETIS